MIRFLPTIALALVGCHSTAVEVVRSMASTDFACPDDKIKVTSGREKGTYRADGCGKKETYACAGWDSYNQQPVCEPGK